MRGVIASALCLSNLLRVTNCDITIIFTGKKMQHTNFSKAHCLICIVLLKRRFVHDIDPTFDMGITKKIYLIYQHFATL
jgi:hypothetical protein